MLRAIEGRARHVSQRNPEANSSRYRTRAVAAPVGSPASYKQPASHLQQLPGSCLLSLAGSTQLLNQPLKPAQDRIEQAGAQERIGQGKVGAQKCKGQAGAQERIKLELKQAGAQKWIRRAGAQKWVGQVGAQQQIGHTGAHTLHPFSPVVPRGAATPPNGYLMPLFPHSADAPSKSIGVHLTFLPPQALREPWRSAAARPLPPAAAAPC